MVRHHACRVVVLGREARPPVQQHWAALSPPMGLLPVFTVQDGASVCGCDRCPAGWPQPPVWSQRCSSSAPSSFIQVLKHHYQQQKFLSSGSRSEKFPQRSPGIGVLRLSVLETHCETLGLVEGIKLFQRTLNESAELGKQTQLQKDRDARCLQNVTVHAVSLLQGWGSCVYSPNKAL